MPRETSQSDKLANYIPRPQNAFMLYKQDKWAQLKESSPKGTNAFELTGIISAQWRAESPAVKAHYADLAIVVKEEHMKKYPGYKYRPGLKRRVLRGDVELEENGSVKPWSPTRQAEELMKLRDEMLAIQLSSSFNQFPHVPQPPAQYQAPPPLPPIDLGWPMHLSPMPPLPDPQQTGPSTYPFDYATAMALSEPPFLPQWKPAMNDFSFPLPPDVGTATGNPAQMSLTNQQEEFPLDSLLDTSELVDDFGGLSQQFWL